MQEHSEIFGWYLKQSNVDRFPTFINVVQVFFNTSKKEKIVAVYRKWLHLYAHRFIVHGKFISHCLPHDTLTFSAIIVNSGQNIKFTIFLSCIRGKSMNRWANKKFQSHTYINTRQKSALRADIEWGVAVHFVTYPFSETPSLFPRYPIIKENDITINNQITLCSH